MGQSPTYPRKHDQKTSKNNHMRYPILEDFLSISLSFACIGESTITYPIHPVIPCECLNLQTSPEVRLLRVPNTYLPGI